MHGHSDVSCFLGHTRETLKTSYPISCHLRLHSPFIVAGLRWFTANLGNGFPLLLVSPSFDVLAPCVMNRGAWSATAHRVSKSWTQLKQLKHAYTVCHSFDLGDVLSFEIRSSLTSESGHALFSSFPNSWRLPTIIISHSPKCGHPNPGSHF